MIRVRDLIGLFRTHPGRYTALGTLLTVLSLSACQLPDEFPGNGNGQGNGHAHVTPSPTPRPTPVCTGSPIPATWTFNATKIQGYPNLLYTLWDLIALADPNWVPDSKYLTQQYVFFKSSDLLKVFDDPSIVVENASLEFNVVGKDHREAAASIELDVNGIRTVGATRAQVNSNGNGNNGNGNGNSGNNNGSNTRYSLILDAVKLNGAEPFYSAFRRIALKRGQLILVLQGMNLKIKNVKLVINGHIGIECQPDDPEATPTPVPSPTPIPAPHTTIDSVNPTGATVGSSSMTIAFSSDQQAVTYQCSLDSAPASLCTSPIVYSNLVSGAHHFTVAAVNASNVKDPVGASYDWTVDLVPPGVTITNAASLPTLSNAADMTFEFSATKPSTYKCSMDGAAYTACTSPASYFGLSEGLHQFAVRATDNLGNQSDPAQFSWSIDLTAPIAMFVDVVPAESYTHSTSSTLTFSANESATLECRLDQAAFAACTSPVQLTQLQDGTHNFQIRARDLAGNLSAIATYAWTVDTIAPVLSLGQVIPAAGLTSATAISAEFSANETSHYQCSFDGGAWSACTSPFSQAQLGEGNHQLSVLATDLAGNPSNTETVAWIMDHTNPTLAWGAMSPSAASVISSKDFSAIVTGSEPVILSCALNNAPLSQTTSPVTLTNLAEGAYHLAVTGHDGAGNASEFIFHDFTVDLTAPSISLSSAVQSATSQNFNTLTFGANETASFECSLDHAGFALCSSPMTVSGLAEGDHVFEVRATDVAGNVSAAQSVGWSVDSVAPIVTSINLVVGRASVTVNWTTNEPATSRVDWGPGVTVVNSTSEDSQLVTNHSVTVSGLNPSTIYTVVGAGHDAAGNSYISAKKQFRTNQ